MAEKKEENAPAVAAEQAQAQAEPTNRDRWLENMRAKYPDIEDEDALYEASMKGYDEEHDFAKRQRAENEQLAEVMQKSPEVAAFFSEVIERGVDGHPELAFINLGDLLQAYMKGEITSDEYIAEKEKRGAAEAEKQQKVEAQLAALTAWCEKKGYDVDEWLEKANQALLSPLASFELAEAQFEALDKMLNYDEDVEAAEIRGKNANIAEKRRRAAAATDGMQNGGSAAGTPVTKNNPLADMVNRRAAMRNL